MQRKGNIDPEARGDAKWHSAALIVPWREISGRWGGYYGGRLVGERSALMGAAPFPLFN